MAKEVAHDHLQSWALQIFQKRFQINIKIQWYLSRCNGLKNLFYAN